MGAALWIVAMTVCASACSEESSGESLQPPAATEGAAGAAPGETCAPLPLAALCGGAGKPPSREPNKTNACPASPAGIATCTSRSTPSDITSALLVENSCGGLSLLIERGTNATQYDYDQKNMLIGARVIDYRATDPCVSSQRYGASCELMQQALPCGAPAETITSGR